MSYRKFKNNGGSHRRITLGGVAAIVLAGVILSTVTTAGIGILSKGFTDSDVQGWFQRELNEDNLIKVDDYVEIDEETDKGLKIKIRDDGTVVLSGCQDETEDPDDSYYDIKLADVTVEPGTYTLSAGNDRASKDTFCLQYEYISGDEKIVNWVYDGSQTLTFTETTTITLSIAVVRGEHFFGIMSYLRPVLVPEGTANTDYYK